MKPVYVLLFILVFVNFSSFYEVHEYRLGHECTKSEVRKDCGDELLCTSSACAGCYNNSQCQEKHSMYKCLHSVTHVNGKREKIGLCFHKNLFPRYTVFDILATIFSFVGGGLSSVGGIGGGGLFVPIFTAIGQFRTNLAIPLSKAMIFGAAICNFLILLPQKYRLNAISKKPVIDYDACLILEPFTLQGTVIGVFLNVICPEWLIVALLFIILSFISVRTLVKGILIFRRERREIKDAKAEKDKDEVEMKESFLKKDEEKLFDDLSSKKLNEHERKELNRILKSEEKFPPYKIMALMFVWVVIFVVSLIKGGHGAPSIFHIPPCSWLYWGLVFIIFPVSISVGMAAAVYCNIKYMKKVKLQYKFAPGEIKWSKFHAFVIPIFATLAGVFAGMLGIGGGMVKGPLLLELGVKPRIASATSLFMILFTSSITTAQFVILGRLPFDYGVYFIVNGFVSALVGQMLVGWIIRKFKMQSIIVIVLSLVIGVATLCLVGSGIFYLVRDIRDGIYMGFKFPC